MSNFSFGKVGGILPAPTVSARPMGKSLGCPEHDCPAGFVRNAVGVCVIAQPVGTTYFIRTLAGPRRK